MTMMNSGGDREEVAVLAGAWGEAVGLVDVEAGAEVAGAVNGLG